MTGPRRLKDDPDFRWETGCDMADEQMGLPTVDLLSVKAALMAKLETAAAVGDGVPAVRPGPSAAASAVKPVTGIVVAAAVVFGAYWLGVKTGAELEVAPADAVVERVVSPVSDVPVVLPAPVGTSHHETEADVPVVEDPAGPSSEAAPDQLVLDLKPVLDSKPVVDSTSDGVGTVTSTGGSASADASADPGTPELAETSGPVDSSQASDATDPIEAVDLDAAQPVQGGVSDAERALTLYTEANQALRSGHAAAARSGFERYLDEFPDRYMSAEASLGLLQALFAIKDAAATEVLAGQLEQLPALADKRGEILRLQAEALVLLDRCVEALLVVEALSTREGAPVRRACRQQRKGDVD